MNMPQTIEDRKFLRSHEIPKEFIENAEKLAKKEEFLFSIIFAEDINEVIHDALARDITASYQIEREYLDSEVVKSYIISSLGLKVTDWMETDWTSGCEEDGYVPREKRAVDGIMACLNDRPLTHEMIFEVNGLVRGNVQKAYRDHPEVVRAGKFVIYRAPEAEDVPGYMDGFLNWWHTDRLRMPASIGAAVAHYNFVAIHPFLDGNGRTARALAEKALITSPETRFRPYSLSSSILRESEDYYGALRTGSPIVFIRFMLGIHEKAIENGIREARRLGFLKGFFNRHEFSDDEKRVIRKISTEKNSRWLPGDVSYLPNGETVFEELRMKGIIDQDGRFNTGWRPEDSPKP